MTKRFGDKCKSVLQMSESTTVRNGPGQSTPRISQALIEAHRDMLRTHRRAGVPVVVLENGEIRELPAEEIERALEGQNGNGKAHA